MNAEELRNIINVNEPDPRWECYHSFNAAGEYTSITLEEFMAPIKDIALSDHVPMEVKIHFETAKNLALYSWFVYRFIPVSKLHAFTSVEFALRLRTGNKKKPFSKLFKQAVDEDWFNNENFTQWRNVTETKRQQYIKDVKVAKYLNSEAPEEPEYWNYLEVLVDVIPYFRNELAHGSSSITPDPYSALVDSAELINQIFDPKNITRQSR